jgi:hypothetical protein
MYARMHVVPQTGTLRSLTIGQPSYPSSLPTTYAYPSLETAPWLRLVARFLRLAKVFYGSATRDSLSR